VAILGLGQRQQVCLLCHQGSRPWRTTGNVSVDDCGWKVGAGGKIRWTDRQPRWVGGFPQHDRRWPRRYDARHQCGADLLGEVGRRRSVGIADSRNHFGFRLSSQTSPLHQRLLRQCSAHPLEVLCTLPTVFAVPNTPRQATRPARPARKFSRFVLRRQRRKALPRRAARRP
jgi:hypothetical protein